MYTDRQRRQYANKLRKNQTPEERKLWPLVLFGFRRQVVTPINYCADFYHKRTRIIVEVDGGVHKAQRARDKARDRHHREKDITTIRVSNGLVNRARGIAILYILIRSILWQLYIWYRV